MSATPPDGGGAGPEKGAGKKPRAAQLPPETFARYGRISGWLLLALLVSYILLQTPLPYRLGAVVVGLVGFGGAIFLLVQCFREKLPVLMHISAVATLIGCGMFAGTAGSQALFWEATAEFDECRTTALTDRSLSRCYQEYERGMLDTVPGMGG